MKAAVYYETGAPDVLRYEDVADPQVYPGGVVIDVEAISIEGGDTLNRAGGEMTGKPHIVGYQCAGTIREVGEGVTDRHVSQKVVATMLSGSHAEVDAVPAATNGVGVSIVVASVGGRILVGSLQCVAYRGRCITVGQAGRDPQPLDISVLSMGNQSLTGVFLGAEIVNEGAGDMIGRLIGEGAFRALRRLLERTFPL